MTRLCECHGEPMGWAKDARKAQGGYWRCLVKARAASLRYNRTEKARARDQRYEASEKASARYARYRASDKSRAVQARFWASDKGRRLRRIDTQRRTTGRREARIQQIEELLT